MNSVNNRIRFFQHICFFLLSFSCLALRAAAESSGIAGEELALARVLSASSNTPDASDDLGVLSEEQEEGEDGWGIIPTAQERASKKRVARPRRMAAVGPVHEEAVQRIAQEGEQHDASEPDQKTKLYVKKWWQWAVATVKIDRLTKERDELKQERNALQKERDAYKRASESNLQLLAESQERESVLTRRVPSIGVDVELGSRVLHNVGRAGSPADQTLTSY